MSGNNKLVRALLDVLSQALPSKTARTSQHATGGSSKPRPASRAKWKQSKPQRSETPTRSDMGPGDESFGQYGSGATRDCTPAEIRSLEPEYAPHLDGDPDPGEVIWTWVPYVENDGRGKDRPVLIISRLGSDAWAGCYLSTKQHHGFVSVGSGPWDSKGRESFLSPERVLRITDEGMRRESTGIARDAFVHAVDVVLRFHGLK